MNQFRPVANTKKIHSKDEFELCYLRHQYLRRVDYNPTPQEMKPYQHIVDYMARNTFYTYRYLFGTIGMELDDIANINRVFLVEFIGLFEFNEHKKPEKYAKFWLTFLKKNNQKSPTDKDVLNKNKADFTLFMKQRLGDLIRVCKQKSKNIKGFRMDEYEPFYGPQEPPEDTHKLLEDNEAYGFKRIDNVAFKAVKKKAKADIKKPFKYLENWYVAVFLKQRNMTILDLSGADLDPYECEHNQNPEQILINRSNEKKLDKSIKMFKNYSKEEKATVFLSFIEKNENNPHFEEEITIAKRFLREMSAKNVRD